MTAEAVQCLEDAVPTDGARTMAATGLLHFILAQRLETRAVKAARVAVAVSWGGGG